MSKSIVIVLPHELGRDEARRRLAAEIEELKRAYVDKFATSEVNWTGDVALIRVVALAQEIKAQVDVTAASVRIEVFLPWILSRLAGPVQNRVASTACDALALTYSSTKD